MARSSQNQRRGRRYLQAFGVLILCDFALFTAHAVLLVLAWKERGHDELLELTIAAAHFVVNSLAIADLFVHLLRFDSDDSCEFEPAKSTNAFLYSLVGAYSDLAAVALSEPGGRVRTLAWALFAESSASALVSIGCYAWGMGTIRVCDEKPVRRGALRSI